MVKRVKKFLFFFPILKEFLWFILIKFHLKLLLYLEVSNGIAVKFYVSKSFLKYGCLYACPVLLPMWKKRSEKKTRFFSQCEFLYIRLNTVFSALRVLPQYSFQALLNFCKKVIKLCWASSSLPICLSCNGFVTLNRKTAQYFGIKQVPRLNQFLP